MYISLDQSTSSTTVFLYNNKLKLLYKASKLHKQIQKKSGFVEHDANEIYNNFLHLVKKIEKKIKYSQNIFCNCLLHLRELILKKSVLEAFVKSVK